MTFFILKCVFLCMLVLNNTVSTSLLGTQLAPAVKGPIPGSTCSFVNIKTFGTLTPRYTSTALAWMREGPMRSLRGQNVHTFMEMLHIMTTPDLHKVIFAELGDTACANNVTIMIGQKVYAYKGSKAGPASIAGNWIASNDTKQTIMKRNVDHAKCEFITVSRLDADDLIAPKFFSALHKVIKNTYSGRSSRNVTWLGGFFSFREALNWHLMLGDHAYKDSKKPGAWCRWKDLMHTGMTLSSGLSLGQTKALRVSVWEKIGFSVSTNHVYALNTFREHVVHNYLNDTAWRAKTTAHMQKQNHCSDATKRKQRQEGHGNDKLFCDDDQFADQDHSRVWLMDVMGSGAMALKPAGIYMLTPLSGHYPWYHHESIGVHKFKHLCDSPEGLKQANAHFASLPIDAYLNASKAIFSDDKFNVLDACKSNLFWRKLNEPLFRNTNETCEQMAKRLMA